MFGLVPFKFNNGENNRGLTINDMFNDFFNDDMLSKFNSSGSFKTDIKETPEEYIVHAELPGVKKEDIKIDYNNNYLTISATRNNESEEKERAVGISEEKRLSDICEDRYGILGQTMNLPGKSGRKVSSMAYSVARRLIGFN